MSIAHQTHLADGDAEVTVSEARVLADCAFSAGSGDRGQAGSYILERLRDILHADAAAIFAWNPAAHRHVLVSNLDYTQPTLDGLSDPYADTEPHQRMLSTHQPLRIADLPYDYRDTEMYQKCHRAHGFSRRHDDVPVRRGWPLRRHGAHVVGDARIVRTQASNAPRRHRPQHRKTLHPRSTSRIPCCR